MRFWIGKPATVSMSVTGLTREQVKSMTGSSSFYSMEPVDCQIGDMKLKLKAVYLKEDYNSEDNKPNCCTIEFDEIITVATKTQAEIAAEKSVEDARKALESAEKALKKVREK